MFFERTMSFFAGTLGPIVLGIILLQLSQGDFRQHQLLYIVVNILIIALLFYAILRGKIATLQVPRLRELALAVVVFGGVLLFVLIYSPLIHFESRAASESHRLLANSLNLSFLLEIALFAPIREEIWMRGFLQKGAFRNSWWGLLIASSFFSILHAPANIATFIYYEVMGFADGWAYKKSDNLAIPILLHIAWNSLVVAMALLN